MSDMWRNDYTSAGPGAKRRKAAENVKRERLDEKPKQDKIRLNNAERHRPRHSDDEGRLKFTAMDLRRKIIALTLQIGSFGEIVERLDLEGYGPPTKVLISNVRDNAMTVLKVIMAEGLISQKTLDQYRKDAKEEQRRRFKRERDDD